MDEGPPAKSRFSPIWSSHPVRGGRRRSMFPPTSRRIVGCAGCPPQTRRTCRSDVMTLGKIKFGLLIFSSLTTTGATLAGHISKQLANSKTSPILNRWPCQSRRKSASVSRSKNTSVKLARRAGNLALFSRHQACVGLSAGVAALARRERRLV